MYLKALYLKNFRNYREASVFFSPTINYIFGENAQGKTNLLEAIHVLMTGRSFRTHHLEDLIRFNTDFFYLEAHFEKNQVDQVLKFSFDRKGKKILHNHTSMPTLSSLLGLLNGVILSPEDYELIKGGPSSRRVFLDMQIAQTDPLYIHHLSRYLRAMKQRNILLRKRHVHSLDVWEAQMAKSAAYITIKRTLAAKEIEEYSKKSHFDLLKLVYKTHAQDVGLSSEDLYKHFLKEFLRYRPKESELGNTLIGPHKDDLEILLEDKQARYFASEGQQRCTITSLRFAEWLRLKELTNENPIMCIDDVGLSLDQKREAKISEDLQKMGQVFLTAPRPNPLFKDSRRLLISDGTVHVSE